MQNIPLSDIKEAEARCIINTYNRSPGKNIMITAGKGCRVWDENDREYLDFVSGLAVNNLGHCHPAVVDAVTEQAARLLHTSNLYYTEQQVQLAARLVDKSFAGQVFFANSGAEANEGAIKLARKYSKKKYGENRNRIITAGRSFHGRTLATITATGQPRYREGFAPLPEGFDYAVFNDLASFTEKVTADTCAIMIEPVQGEGGVYPADKEFLSGIRQLCDRENILLIYDEVQCGMGRTGYLWAYQASGVEPDIMTVAKALGGGLPIGAMLCTGEVATGFSPGDHASTFGGNPLACRAGVAALDIISDQSFLQQVREKAELLRGGLLAMQEGDRELIREVRGTGLMLAVELNIPAAPDIQQDCQERGLLVNAMGDRVIRLIPPLIVEETEIELFFAIFQAAINELLRRRVRHK